MSKKGIYEKYFKRPFDIFVSFLALLLLSPILIFIGILVKIKLGSPIIFKQKRPGLNEKIFVLYKFRTMTNETDKYGIPLTDDERINKFGNFLRVSSIDELPELLNILKGDMSIVGPRPLLVEYLPLYNTVQRKRHDVRPGLTGKAQISGRNKINWNDKFILDIDYANNIKFSTDIKIIIKTIMKVLKHEGINSQNSVTATKYKGNNSFTSTNLDKKK